VSLPAAPGVNQALLHPTFVRRLEALFSHPDLGALRLVSAVRTEERQQQLYDCYRAHVPGCNVAADPDRPLGDRTLFGETIHAEGSWHMQQDGPGAHDYGYAVDVNYSQLGARARAVIEAEVPRASAYARGAPAPWGLVRTVEAPKWEPWHIQPIGDVTTPFDAPPVEELTMADVAAILAKLENIDSDLAGVRGRVDQVDDLVGARLDAAVATLDDRVEALTSSVTEALTGCAAIVRRSGRRWLILGNRRTDITGADRDTQVEVKAHLGIERNSAECSDEAWAILELLTDPA
jgi:hypothetical protein